MQTAAAIGGTQTQSREVRGVRGTVEVNASQASTINVRGPLGGLVATGTVAAAGGGVTLAWASPSSRVVVEVINTVAAVGIYQVIMTQSREFDGGCGCS
jgi:hypothetical protein